jgi:hypothetical protein
LKSFFLLEWVRLCLPKLLAVLNSLLQISHLNSLLSLWVLRWDRRSLSLLNNLQHSEHSKFLTSLWTIECCLRSLLFLNVFSHSGHLKFFAVWWRSCWWRINSDFVLKDFLQTLHSNSLLFSWRRKWCSKFLLLLKKKTGCVWIKKHILQSLCTN